MFLLVLKRRNICEEKHNAISYKDMTNLNYVFIILEKGANKKTKMIILEIKMNF